MVLHQGGQQKKRFCVHAMLPCFPSSNDRNRNRQLEAEVASPPSPPLFASWVSSAKPIFRPLRSVGHRSTSMSHPRCGAPHNGGRPRRCLRADDGIVQMRFPHAARDRTSFLRMHRAAEKEIRNVAKKGAEKHPDWPHSRLIEYGNSTFIYKIII
jgi:hypothetical protein